MKRTPTNILATVAGLLLAANCGTSGRSGEASDAGGSDDTSSSSGSSGGSSGSGDSGSTSGGGSSSGANVVGGPNIDPSKLVITLSMNDQGILCDWLAQEWGGYGGLLRCDAGSETLSAPLTQHVCLSEALDVSYWGPTCPLTVGQFASCVEWEAQNVCLVGVVEASMLPAECQTSIGPTCSGYKIGSDGGPG